MESRIISKAYVILRLERSKLDLGKFEEPSQAQVRRALYEKQYSFDNNDDYYHTLEHAFDMFQFMARSFDLAYVICKVEVEKTPEKSYLRRFISFFDYDKKEYDLDITVSSQVRGNNREKDAFEKERRNEMRDVRNRGEDREWYREKEKVKEKERYSPARAESRGRKVRPVSDKSPRSYYFVQHQPHNMSKKVVLGMQKGRLFSSLHEAKNYYQNQAWAISRGDGHLIYKIDVTDQDKKELRDMLSENSNRIDLSRFTELSISYQALTLEGSTDFCPVEKQTREQYGAISTLFVPPKNDQCFAAFLGIDLNHDSPSGQFIQKIQPFLTLNFFNLPQNQQVKQLIELRLNRDFIAAMNSNWQMTCLFLDKVIGSNEACKDEILKTRYKSFYIFNNARRQLIPDARMRVKTPISIQQKLVMQALQENINKKHRQDPSITQVLGKLDNEGKITYPEELVCPLTLDLFKNPYAVIQTDTTGKEHRYIFEYEDIKKALERDPRNPLTREPLLLKDLKPAHDIKAKVDDYKKEMAQKKDLVDEAIKAIKAEESEQKPGRRL